MLRRGTFLVPTLSGYYLLATEGHSWGHERSAIEKSRAVLEDHRASFLGAWQAGVPICVGTDQKHGNVTAELELMVRYGLSPLEALRAATLTNARLLDLADDIGQVVAGMRADLVLLGGDPLADVSAIRDVRAVFLGGERVPLEPGLMGQARSVESMMSDPVLERALVAVGRTRALGLHFYGHFIGISGERPSDGRAQLRLDGEVPTVGAEAVSPVALATVADLALGAAVRTRMKPGVRLGTVTLSVHHPPGAVVGPLDAAATVHQVADGHGTAHCSILAAGDTVAQAQGWFAALPPPPGAELPALPWEHAEQLAIGVPSPAELDDAEARAVAAARDAGARARARGTAVSQEMLAFAWRDAAEGRAARHPADWARAGKSGRPHPGGALYGAALLAAAEALGVPRSDARRRSLPVSPTSGWRDARRGGRGGRRGRSVAFVHARLAVDDTLVGSGSFAIRL